MLVSAERQLPRLINREIIFACDHNPPTLQTDGQLIMAIPRYATLRVVKTVATLPSRQYRCLVGYSTIIYVDIYAILST